MSRHAPVADSDIKRLRTVGALWLIIGALFITRLFYIQVVQHDKYNRQASGARDINQTIKAKRGEIFTHDARDGQQALYPVALNRDQILLVSDNRKIEDSDFAATVIGVAASSTPEQVAELKIKLAQKTRAYQILIKDLSVETEERLRMEFEKANVKGLYFDRLPARFYPERDLLAHVTGFVGRNDKGEPIGRYGIEANFDARLQGTNGFVKTEKDPFGGWIPVADREFAAARDGDDIILTIDRTIQLKLCAGLADGIKKHSARSASGLIMDPKTGAIIAMCNLPTFDPNEYQKVTSPEVYNNGNIFTPYEPGSVFKIVTLAAALDAGAVKPNTPFNDEGFVKRDGFTIRNAAEKSFGAQNMIGVIKESINTGTVFAAELLGRDKFRGYVEKFGFGVKSGIELKIEEKGNLKSLSRSGAVFLATASFGQGITTTPLQLVQAYAAIANGGVMMRPSIVHAWRTKSGETEFHKPEEVRRVISKKTADEATMMLRTVVEEGHGKSARVPGYVIVGKTGTAQIAGPGGKYTEDYNHSFIGYGPASNPRFVMLIKYEAPQARFAETTAVPTFGEVAKFLLEYLGVSHDQ